MEFGQKKFREIVLFDFTSFFGLAFFKFSVPLCFEMTVFELSFFLSSLPTSPPVSPPGPFGLPRTPPPLPPGTPLITISPDWRLQIGPLPNSSPLSPPRIPQENIIKNELLKFG